MLVFTQGWHLLGVQHSEDDDSDTVDRSQQHTVPYSSRKQSSYRDLHNIGKDH
jgi:hypothetical protein